MKGKVNNFTSGKKMITGLIIFIISTLMATNIHAQLPKPDHIVIVIEENHNYDAIIGSNSAPYINSLANNGALFTNSHAMTHPSQPNYLWFFSGDNQGVGNDNLPSGLPFTTANLGAELLQKGYTFKGYSEDLPSVGYNGTSSGAYKRKHNPWVNWQDATTNGIPSSLNVPFTDFPTDYTKLPTVCFVIPNQNNDMHDGSVSDGDSWLQSNLDGYIQWAKTHNSLFLFTFDENGGASGNQIATFFVGQQVKIGQYNENVNHVSFLRTIEDMYGLSYAGSSNNSSNISDCWNTSTAIDNSNSAPLSFSLYQNYPNPFNPSTTIKYILPKEGIVTLKVFNVLGKEVKTLTNEFEQAGTHNISFNASTLPSGIYFYRLTSGNFTQVKKLVYIK